MFSPWFNFWVDLIFIKHEGRGLHLSRWLPVYKMKRCLVTSSFTSAVYFPSNTFIIYIYRVELHHLTKRSIPCRCCAKGIKLASLWIYLLCKIQDWLFLSTEIRNWKSVLAVSNIKLLSSSCLPELVVGTLLPWASHQWVATVLLCLEFKVFE